MQINCISCGHRVELGDAYDDYEGRVRCWVCGANLAIKTDAGAIRTMRLASNEAHEVVYVGSRSVSATPTE